MGMGEKVSVLAANDPALAHAFGPDGLFALMQDPEKMAALPPELQRGMGLFGTAMSSPDLLYTGAPLRVGGRTIGTFCCLFLDRGPEAAFSPAEEVLLKTHAARASEVRAPPSSPPRAPPPPTPRDATWRVLMERLPLHHPVPFHAHHPVPPRGRCSRRSQTFPRRASSRLRASVRAKPVSTPTPASPRRSLSAPVAERTHNEGGARNLPRDGQRPPEPNV